MQHVLAHERPSPVSRFQKRSNALREGGVRTDSDFPVYDPGDRLERRTLERSRRPHHGSLQTRTISRCAARFPAAVPDASFFCGFHPRRMTEVSMPSPRNRGDPIGHRYRNQIFADIALNKTPAGRSKASTGIGCDMHSSAYSPTATARTRSRMRSSPRARGSWMRRSCGRIWRCRRKRARDGSIRESCPSSLRTRSDLCRGGGERSEPHHDAHRINTSCRRGRARGLKR